LTDNLLRKSERAGCSRTTLPNVNEAFAPLEYYGRKSAASVTPRAPEAAAEGDREANLWPLSDEELNERIGNLPPVPLTHDAPKEMSLASEQHKLAVDSFCGGKPIAGLLLDLAQDDVYQAEAGPRVLY
jgi:serine/threonine-protein kinase HipA